MNELSSNVKQYHLRRAEQLEKIAPVGPVLLRLTVGAVFISSGWGKLQDVDKVAEFFSELGIIAPHWNAVFVACVELFGGIALSLGLGTRAAAFPLAMTMIVAIWTALLPDVSSPLELVGLNEFIYCTIFVSLLCTGGGRWSLDHWITQRLLRHQSSAAPAPLTVSRT
jgi:putative oxidoreductase